MDDQKLGQKSKVKYICEGICGGEVSEEQYNDGLTTCQTQGCTHFGKPFKKVEEKVGILI